jgi:hypothetical protein
MMTLGTTTRRPWRWTLSCAVPLLGGAGACFPELAALDGSCEIVPESTLDCRVAGYDDELEPAGLVGYACNGSARPDLDATMSEGVPSGLLCADKGPLEDSGEETYCCTENVVPCAYNPADECEVGRVGYQCWGNNRPESLNPALLCSNGTSERGLYHYCCTGQPEPSPCRESMAVGCGDRLLGFLCEGDTLPRGEDYGANRSRADYFYPLCSVARPAPNPAFNSYCCYMTLPVPVGGSCVGHPSVPGCEPGRFGFACYGPDTPEDDFPPMVCPDPGFRGRSDEGYDATLYCCDFT